MPSHRNGLRRLALAASGLAMLVAAPAGAASYTFTTIDVPGATATGAVHMGINDAGDVVGDFVDGNGVSEGFIDSGGSFTKVDIYNDTGPDGTEFFGINGSGQIVGAAASGLTAQSLGGILYESGSITPILPPGALTSVATGINDAGDIVGNFVDASLGHGFLDAGGTFTTLDAPGAFFTRAFGVNGSGQVVGSFDDATGTHGYVYEGGTFTPLDVPGSSRTQLFGIDGAGAIVGSFDDATGTHGFLYSGGTFETIDVPGATLTNVFGINSAGQLVGSFDDATGTHGFVATLPEPGSLVLLAAGLIAALALGRRRPRIARRP